MDNILPIFDTQTVYSLICNLPLSIYKTDCAYMKCVSMAYTGYYNSTNNLSWCIP